jgi:uncharacterized protein (TIGR00255 family)
MTAFASAENSENGYTASTEIRTYNSRYLDIVLRLPQNFLSLEDGIKRLVSDRVSRGRIEIILQLRDNSDPDLDMEIDAAKVKAYQTAVARLKEEFHIRGELTAEFLLSCAGIIRMVESEKDIESCRPFIEKCVAAALDDLDIMRKREGDVIAGDFRKRLGYIEACLERIQRTSADLLPLYQQRLKDRISDLTKGVVEIDPVRVAQEASFYADRSDISEEIIRAGSHLKQFHTIMAAEEPAGRKLNFLLQEFTREFTTMGTKAGNAEVSHIVVEVKSELEKIREQVQNVE